MKTSVRLLLGIFALSVILRVGVAFYLGDVVDAPPLLTDQRSYDALGARLIAGYGFSFDRGWYPFTLPNTPTAHWSFLYSFFVAAVYAVFGVHPLAVRLVQAVLGGILLPAMAYRLTVVLSPEIMAVAHKQSVARHKGSLYWPDVDILPLLAALLTAVYAYFVLYAATLMTETFYMATLLWSLERALTFVKRAHSTDWLKPGLTLGLSLGCSALLRQSILPWVAVLFVWLLWVGWRTGQVRRIMAGVLVTILTMGVLFLPFTLRNYRVYHTFLLLNSNAGYAMYASQHPSHGTVFQNFATIPIPDELWGLNEAQMDRDLMRRGIGFVLADPWRYLQLSWSRVGEYFEFWPTPGTSLLHNLGRMASAALFLPFMIYGLWRAVRNVIASRTHPGLLGFIGSPLALVLLFLVFYSALHIFTWAMPRYRLPVDAVLMSFVALALADLGQRIRLPLLRIFTGRMLTR